MTEQAAPPEEATEEKDHEPVLDLDTFTPPRPTVRIKTKENREGVLYELNTLEDLGIEDQQFMYANGSLLESLMEKPQLTKSQKQKLTLVLDKMTKIALDAPSKVQAQLNDWQKGQVVHAFTMASPSLRQAVQLVEAAARAEQTATSEN